MSTSKIKQRTSPEIGLQAKLGLFYLARVGKLNQVVGHEGHAFAVTNVQAEVAHIGPDGTAFCLDLVIGMKRGRFAGDLSLRLNTQSTLSALEYHLIEGDECQVVIELKADIERAYSGITQLSIYRRKLQSIDRVQREYVLCFGTASTRLGSNHPELTDSRWRVSDICTAATLAGQVACIWPDGDETPVYNRSYCFADSYPLSACLAQLCADSYHMPFADEVHANV